MLRKLSQNGSGNGFTLRRTMIELYCFGLVANVVIPDRFLTLFIQKRV